MRTDVDEHPARDAGLPPGPPGGPATNLPAWLLEPLRTLRWCAARYGDIFTLDLGPFGPFVFVADPELIRRTFLADPNALHAGETNSVLAPIVGTRSVLTSDGARHLRQRKLLLPPFHGSGWRSIGSGSGGWALEPISPRSPRTARCRVSDPRRPGRMADL